uniref:Calx-beta domain-containing protein n=1 Tax=Mycolicibacterium tokaiense TaxID=39695 RepID=UPI0021F27C48
DGSVYSIDEGNSGITTTPVRVKLSEASTETITVTYKVERAYLTNSATAGTDFIEETGTLTFTPGQTIATLPVQVYGDTTYEDNEYIHIELTGATGAILSLDGTPGQTIATLPVQVYGDTTYEDNEYIHIELTGATGAILSLDGSTSAYPTIRNDDAPNANSAAVTRRDL